jgi:D-inositol-3-phosphate glycosyltransferase
MFSATPMIERPAPGSLRVLMVSQQMLPHVAGAELQAFRLARSLRNCGVDAQIVSTKFARGLAGREMIEGVPVRRLAVLRGSTPAAVKTSQLISTASYVAAHPRSFDVIHGHCLSSASLGAALGARIGRRPVIIKPSLGGPGGELRKIVDSPAARWIIPMLRRVDRFAVLDQSIADELIQIGVCQERLVPVNNGIELELFRPASREERRWIRARLDLGEGPLALFVGQIIERKGVRELLEAWRLMRTLVDNATLVFVGDGPQAGSVRREAEQPGSKVKLLGVRRDVAELMRTADVLVLPSHNESFPNVVVEAMACGLPVVVSCSGVVQTLSIDGAAGTVVDPNSPAEIAHALCEILRSPERREELGAGGRSLVERFDFHQVARHYLSIYQSMIESYRR